MGNAPIRYRGPYRVRVVWSGGHVQQGDARELPQALGVMDLAARRRSVLRVEVSDAFGRLIASRRGRTEPLRGLLGWIGQRIVRSLEVTTFRLSGNGGER